MEHRSVFSGRGPCICTHQLSSVYVRWDGSVGGRDSPRCAEVAWVCAVTELETTRRGRAAAVSNSARVLVLLRLLAEVRARHLRCLVSRRLKHDCYCERATLAPCTSGFRRRLVHANR